VRDVTGPIRADVQAGSLRIDGFQAPLELSTQAGSVRARGRLTSGASTVRCNAGSVGIHLDQGSDVRVSARTTLGSVRFNSERSAGPTATPCGSPSPPAAT